MIAALRRVRVSRAQLIGLSVLSAIASALIISNAGGTTAAQREALAALARRRVVVHVAQAPAGAPDTAPAAAQPAALPSVAPAAPSAGASAGSATAVSAPAPATPPAPAAPTQHVVPATPAAAAPRRSPVKHVFTVMLSTPGYEAAFGRSSVAAYLNRTLRPQGVLLSGYSTLAGTALPDELALVSGQAPNADTLAGCPVYSEFPEAAKPARDGQVPGAGCVYPNTALTIGDQVTASGHRWGAYIGGMTSGSGAKASCVHPNSGAADPQSGDYATSQNPFVYFHSLLDLGDCASDDVPLTELPAALRSAAATPSYVLVAPGACESGASRPGCPAASAVGLKAADAFLAQWVPQILHSPAYKDGGALIIAFTAAPAGAPQSAASRAPVRVGALVLSSFAHRGATDAAAYGPYSLLRTVEDLFGFAPLAHAGQARSLKMTVLGTE